MASSSSKRPRLSDEDDTAVDRISNLPDEIKRHILSLLTTKQAVQTTLLSQKWNGFWTQVPTLHFQDFEFVPLVDSQCRLHWHNHQVLGFEEFVNNVLLRYKSTEIKKFFLHWDPCCPLYFSPWITFAVSRNLQCLKIHIASDDQVDVPSSLFTCRTLEFLELVGESETPHIAPTSVFLPRLQTLILSCVSFDHNESLPILLRGCMILRRLSIRRHGCDNSPRLTIRSPSLRYLSVYLLPGLTKDCELKINTPSLEYLRLFDRARYEYRLQNLTSLIESEIDVVTKSGTPEDYAVPVSKLERALSHSKSLTLGYGTVQAYSENTPPMPFSKFQKITKLVFTDECMIWTSFLLLFEKSVNLEVLVFQMRHDLDAISEVPPPTVPTFLHSKLRKFTLVDFNGDDVDFAVIRHFLQHGKVLEQIDIYFSDNDQTEEEYDQMIEKISDFYKASEICEIHFHDKTDPFELRIREGLEYAPVFVAEGY